MHSLEEYPLNQNEDANAKFFDFSTESIRRGFIRKVYGLLSIQLIFTFGLVLLFCSNQAVQEWAVENLWILVIALIVELVTIISFYCCETIRRTHPANLIFLIFYTLGSAVCVAYIGATFSPATVLIAAGLTACMVIALTLFAIQTKWDFTKLSGALFIAFVMFIVVGIVAACIRDHYLSLILAYIGVVLFSIYLIHDTQLIVGGNYKYELSPEEYILGAIHLYIDIIEIFIYLLHIVAGAKK